jgi:hypothetical protein
MEVLKKRGKESTSYRIYHADSVAQGLTELSSKIKQSIQMFMVCIPQCALRMHYS